MFLKGAVSRGILAISCLLGLLLLQQPALRAAPYGTGSYNKCTYACTASTLPNESIILPSGLTVTINLLNGQKIPREGYVVVVQPAEGQMGRLKQVSFYMNDAHVYTGTPNEIGAVRWLWQPSASDETIQLKLVITAEDGSVTTQVYTLVIGKPDPVPSPQPIADSPIASASRAVLGFVATLPTPVLYGAPYFLFALLLGNILLLAIQTQREMREVAVLSRIIAIERKTGLEKTTFISLASHYLRTPMSIIQGGFDLLRHSPAMTAATSAAAERAIDNLRLNIDSLLARGEAASQIAGAQSDEEPLPSPWRSPGLYVPILLIGLFVVAFNYMAANVASFSVNQLTILLQIAAFCLVVVLLYQAIRRRQLHRRDMKRMQRALAHEQAINQTRDELITESTALLGGDLATLRSTIEPLPQNDATTFIRDGIARFKALLAKFAIAGQLRSAHALQQGTQTDLSSVVRRLPENLGRKLTEQKIELRIDTDTPFLIQNPQLITYVIASLLDNAAAYSKPGSSIQLASRVNGDNVEITVTDHGAGISPAKLSLLFRPFSQTQDSERYTHDGMGFSLYLDRLIMTYLGGEISLRSKPGVETTATLLLPSRSN